MTTSRTSARAGGGRNLADRVLDRLPRALAGDWSPLVRDPLDLLRLALLVAAPMTLAVGPREQSVRLLLTFLLVLIPRALDVPRMFDLGFIAAMYFQAWGNVFGAFDGIYGYDKVVHFILPAASSAVMYIVLMRLGAVPDLRVAHDDRHRVGIVVITSALGLTVGGGLYELYEWLANHHLGANLYVSYGDSIGDLATDGLGSLLGGALLVMWQVRGWGTRRRRRGEAPGRDADPLARAGQQLVERLRPEPAGERPPRELPRLPRWLAGDWSGPIRDPIDLLRLLLVAGVPAAAVDGEPELTLRFGVTFLATLAVRRLELPRPFDLAFVVAMLVQAWGAYAGAFAAVAGYGPVVHLIVSASAAAVLYIAVVRLELVPDLSEVTRIHQRLAIALTGFCLGFSAGIVYEMYVYVANELLGAGFPVDYGIFIGHLALDAVGALAGAAALAGWAALGWRTRRVPGRALRRAGEAGASP